MNHPSLHRVRDTLAALAFALASTGPALAQKPLEFVVGGTPPKAAGGEPLVFHVAELSAIQLVPREAGSAPNQHPRALDAETLRQQLAAVRFRTPKGKSAPLFGASEIADLVKALPDALAAAKPDQDLLLLSTSRRDDALFMAPLGLTARLFVANDKLQLIVHDARLDYHTRWRASGVRPEFRFGSRAAAGPAALAAASEQPRPDWVALPLTPRTNAAPAGAPASAAAPAQAQPAAPTDTESRLRMLKRLRDENLITEDEYRQKRAEILKTL
jgi:hypothetical protein